MTDHLQTGSLGEDVACAYLSSIGYTILSRNAREKFGEIDIIAKDPDGILVFVEVKTLSSPEFLFPEDNLTRAKFKKLSRTCLAYANAHPELVDSQLGWRIDLVAIVVNPPYSTTPDAHLFQYGKNNFAISHYKNISLA
ncbi:MAG: hypothetical protein UT41_C0001G0004 [Candidatus Wolfebacteria bacterium GW2011_GWC2_39_22]|uniref:UPF0102 protein UT41_C0001G0004 n=1 Tax=Candidatus Wolfebacteria bacterium GW2011_GWC2_39_22 TaxID=1619013 RepID=A0A0G0QPX3_9BACT|nr:MAG: hypothetical protein UT41_C0001G0004 [Candidatus Wolfebacteria bacterium GW2011_GWC2_39_22]HBI25860.1 hypothetical protein [Candidatus Wolfebacteria bacterium]